METLDEYRIHMNGLERMIEVRGGLNALGYNGILKNVCGMPFYQFSHPKIARQNSKVEDSRLRHLEATSTNLM